MHPICILWCAGTSRHRHTNHCGPNNYSRGSKERCRALSPARGVAWDTDDPEPFDQPMHPTLVCRQPAPAATPTTVARTTTAEGRRKDVGLGLVPSQGSGVGSQTTTEPFDQPMHPIVIPWRGTSRHRPATPTTVARTTTAEGRRRDVGLGLVPSQGSGVGYRRPLNPSINQCTQFSYLGVPAPAGTGRQHQPLWPEQLQPRVEGEM